MSKKETELFCDNIDIEKVNCIKFLGVYIDCKLTRSEHVNSVRTKMANSLSVMRRVKWLLNGPTLYTVHLF